MGKLFRRIKYLIFKLYKMKFLFQDITDVFFYNLTRDKLNYDKKYRLSYVYAVEKNQKYNFPSYTKDSYNTAWKFPQCSSNTIYFYIKKIIRE